MVPPLGRRLRSMGGRSARSLVLCALLVMLIVGPLAGLLYSSFQPNRGSSGGLTLDHYRALGSATLRTATVNTFWVSLAATAASVAIGGGLAWLVTRTDVPGRAIVQIAGIVPLFFSALVGALAWSALASPRTGYLNAMLDALGVPITLNIYSNLGIVFVLTLYYAPFAYLMIFAAFTLNSGDLEGAARVHGASQWKVARQVTFPLVLPSIFASSILIFILVSENFPVVEILGSFARIDFLPTYIFRLINESPPRHGEAAAIGVVLLVILWLLVWAQNRFVHRRSYVTVGGKGTRPSHVRLGRWRWVGFGAAAMYVVLAAILPVVALVLGAFRKNQFYTDLPNLFSPDEFTTANFTESLRYEPFTVGLRNSVLLAVGAALLGVLINFVFAYASKRRAVYFSKSIEYVALAPVAMPALLMGLSFVVFWLKLPFPLYGTLTILVIAYTARFIPQGFENFATTLVKLDDQLEDSAVTAGARRSRAVFSITLPLLRSTAFSTGILLFILAFRELTVALFLYTPNTRPLSVVIYNQWSSGSWERTASMSLVFTFVLLVAAVAGRRGMAARE
jgi:iron(III) transport system permease protein